MRSARTLGVAGVGLIGASIGLRATAAGYDVCGWDASLAHAARARERGAIATVARDVRALGDAVETLVIAAPLDATLALVRAFAEHPPRATLVIDVASVKAPVARAATGLAAFVGTHPIAGSERTGPDAARADLFADRVWTVDAGAPPTLVARANDFVREMGARPIAIAAGEHDRVVALTSHLPQVLAVALATYLGERLDEPHVRELCGTGMSSMLRLGRSSWTVWRAILEANGPAVAQEVRGLADVLFSVAENLDTYRVDGLAGAFAASAAAVARLNGNDAPAERVDEPIPVTDER